MSGKAGWPDNSTQYQHIEFHLNIDTNRNDPDPQRASPQWQLQQTVCLCVRINNRTRAIKPLPLHLITPFTSSFFVQRKKKRRGGAWGGLELKIEETEAERESQRMEWMVGVRSDIDIVQINEGLADAQSDAAATFATASSSVVLLNARKHAYVYTSIYT